MAWTTLSVLTELKKNLPMLKDTSIKDADLYLTIQDADGVIYDDLSKYVDWDEVEALDDVPRVINRLAQYQTVMLTIIRHFYNDDAFLGSYEKDEEAPINSIYKYYEGRYNKLMRQLAQGSIRILDDDNEELEADVARTPGLGRII